MRQRWFFVPSPNGPLIEWSHRLTVPAKGGRAVVANPGLTPSFRRSLPETGCLSQGLPCGKCCAHRVTFRFVPGRYNELAMRAWNRTKLLWGYLTRRARLDALPVEYIVETTAKCN